MYCREKLLITGNNVLQGEASSRICEQLWNCKRRHCECRDGEITDAQAVPQGLELSTLCFPLSKLHLRDLNKNGVWLTRDSLQKKKKKKAKDLLFLLVNVAIYIHLSAVNQVPRKCTRNCQRESCFSSPAHLVMQGEREGEKEDKDELREVMVSACHGDWQYRNTWQRPDLSGTTWMYSSHFQTKFSEDENSCE